MIQRTLAATGIAALAATVLTAQAAGGHEHGVARLDVAIDGPNLQVSLESPLYNLVGFEHAPKSEAQRAALNRMTARLKDGKRQFLPDEAAACHLVDADARHSFQAGAGADGHADADAQWTWRCERPEALKRLDVRLFDDFPRLKTLRVQMATPRGQNASTLTRSRRIIAF